LIHTLFTEFSALRISFFGSFLDIEGRSDNATVIQTLASLDCRYLGCRLGFSPVTYFVLGMFLRYSQKKCMIFWLEFAMMKHLGHLLILRENTFSVTTY